MSFHCTDEPRSADIRKPSAAQPPREAIKVQSRLNPKVLMVSSPRWTPRERVLLAGRYFVDHLVSSRPTLLH